MSNRTHFTTFLGVAPLPPSPLLSSSARSSSPKTQVRDLCWTGRRSGQTSGAPSCCTDSTDLAAYQSLTGCLQEMEVPTTMVVMRLGLARSAVCSRSLVPVVLGDGPVDQQRCVPSSGSPAPSACRLLLLLPHPPRDGLMTRALRPV
jgi:hypothetical protein